MVVELVDIERRVVGFSEWFVCRPTCSQVQCDVKIIDDLLVDSMVMHCSNCGA